MRDDDRVVKPVLSSCLPLLMAARSALRAPQTRLNEPCTTTSAFRNRQLNVLVFPPA